MNAWTMGLLLWTGAFPGSPGQETPGPLVGTGTVELTVEPTEVQAGMFFDGAALTVSALVPEGLAVTFSCVGEEEPVLLNRKGKVLGLIWMNVGEVEIGGAPDLYVLKASGMLSEMAPPSSLEELGLGYAALQARADLPGGGQEAQDLFGEFVGLKESDGLYAVSEGAVERAPQGNGMDRVSTEIRLPAKAPPGEYRVLAHGFASGQGVLLGSTEVRLSQVGMAASIRSLATRHGLAYGILAVVVAIGVGLLTGVLFGLGSRKAH